MAIKTNLQRLMAILALISILACGQLILAPAMGYTVNATETDDNAGATENAENGNETDDNAGATDNAEGGGGGWDYLMGEQYENLPFEPIEREANNIVLGAGLLVAVVAIGGAIVVDRRNQN